MKDICFWKLKLLICLIYQYKQPYKITKSRNVQAFTNDLKVHNGSISNSEFEIKKKQTIITLLLIRLLFTENFFVLSIKKGEDLKYYLSINNAQVNLEST